MNFFNQQVLGMAQMCLTVQQILGNSINGNAIRSKFPLSQIIM